MPRYYNKYKRLKKFAKDLIFQNAAICDEVEKVDNQILATEEENRCLTKRVLQFEQMAEKGEITLSLKTSSGHKIIATKVVPRKIPGSKQKIADIDLLKGTQPTKPKAKRYKGGFVKKSVPLLPLDEFGRPILPLELGELTVHSLGEIVYDKATFHCMESIYPVGFCSTRVYASNVDPNTNCLYTCRISDEKNKPLFEISPEESPDEIYSGATPEQSLSTLIKSLKLYIIAAGHFKVSIT